MRLTRVRALASGYAVALGFQGFWHDTQLRHQILIAIRQLNPESFTAVLDAPKTSSPARGSASAAQRVSESSAPQGRHYGLTPVLRILERTVPAAKADVLVCLEAINSFISHSPEAAYRAPFSELKNVELLINLALRFPLGDRGKDSPGHDVSPPADLGEPSPKQSGPVRSGNDTLAHESDGPDMVRRSTKSSQKYDVTTASEVILSIASQIVGLSSGELSA